MNPSRTPRATASIRVRTRSLEQTFSRYPDTVSDMLKIAQHRGWAEVRVVGDEGFRREAWIQAQALGLGVRGYQPRDRDRQAAGAQSPSPKVTVDRMRADDDAVKARLQAAAVVVKRLIDDPAARSRLMERAVERLRAQDTGRRADRDKPDREARRDRRT